MSAVNNLKSVLVSVLLLINVSTGSRCTFPRLWEGEYFHLGYSSSLIVNNNSITEKGECVWSDGSQYVLKSQDAGKDCWRCLSIYRKHQNVLQYKESDCEYQAQFTGPNDLCTRIAGDDPMFSMFRTDAQPTRCPLRGPYMFSYARGGTGPACAYPASYMDTCGRDHSRLQLHYQACIDVAGSESAREVVRCLAAWRDGSKSYFVGELMAAPRRRHQLSEERRYRCYVYEQYGKGDNRTVKMAESAAATCKGLWSPAEGYKVFDMERVVGSGERCVFPRWFTAHHTWTAIDSTSTIHINSGQRSFKLRHNQRVEATMSHPSVNVLTPVFEDVEWHYACQEQVVQARHSVQIVHYVKSANCDSGYVCASISKIADNVIGVEFGEKARNPREACTSLYFMPSDNISSIGGTSNRFQQRRLYVARSHRPGGGGVCPLNGRYSLQSIVGVDAPQALTQCDQKRPTVGSSGDSATTLSVLTGGCGGSDHLLRVESLCQPPHNRTKTEFRCHAHWLDPDGVSRLILSDGGSSGSFDSDRLLCLSYTESAVRLSVGACRLEPAQLVLRQTGPCLQALSSVSALGTSPHAPFHRLVRVGTLIPLLFLLLTHQCNCINFF